MCLLHPQMLIDFCLITSSVSYCCLLRSYWWQSSEAGCGWRLVCCNSVWVRRLEMSAVMSCVASMTATLPFSDTFCQSFNEQSSGLVSNGVTCLLLWCNLLAMRDHFRWVGAIGRFTQQSRCDIGTVASLFLWDTSSVLFFFFSVTCIFLFVFPLFSLMELGGFSYWSVFVLYYHFFAAAYNLQCLELQYWQRWEAHWLDGFTDEGRCSRATRKLSSLNVYYGLWILFPAMLRFSLVHAFLSLPGFWN